MYNLCTSFNCLPRAGGLYDQDPQEIELLMKVGTAKAEADKSKGSRGGAGA